MTEKRSRTKKVSDTLDRVRETAEIGKMVSPDVVDREIDKGIAVVDAAQTGISLFERLKNVFKRKAK